MAVTGLHLGDNLAVLAEMADNSVDSIVSDPPYGLQFMNKKWDYDVPKVVTWKECLRVLKPGGHILIACGTRTQHRMAVNIEDAGFEIRDLIAWVYGSGFPKSLNISKAIDEEMFKVWLNNNPDQKEKYIEQVSQAVASGNPDAFFHVERKFKKMAGAARERLGTKYDLLGFGHKKVTHLFNENNKWIDDENADAHFVSSPATPEAEQWNGFGTALKPAMELWTLARKPISEKTIAKNVLKWGVGGLNIDGCRINSQLTINNSQLNEKLSIVNSQFSIAAGAGRFPANLIHDGSPEVLELFPSEVKSEKRKVKNENINSSLFTFHYSLNSASRYFYCAKASPSERNAGLEGKFDLFEQKEGFEEKIAGGLQGRADGTLKGGIVYNRNNHPTVKPLKLMQYLCRLITPPKGIVFDPFMGSGTTGCAAALEGFDFIGIEMSEEYFKIAEARINHWSGKTPPPPCPPREGDKLREPLKNQLSIVNYQFSIKKEDLCLENAQAI